MNLIKFENKPSTKTPWTAENVNHNFDEIENEDKNNIKTTGNQTINGTKTFESSISVNSKPIEDNDVVRLKELNEMTDGKWIDLTLNTGWINQDATSYNKLQYKKEGSKVYLRGIIKRTSGSDQNITTLPVEIRPKKSNGLITYEVGNKIHLIYIHKDGQVNATSAYETNQWISLDGLMYFLD